MIWVSMTKIEFREIHGIMLPAVAIFRNFIFNFAPHSHNIFSLLLKVQSFLHLRHFKILSKCSCSFKNSITSSSVLCKTFRSCCDVVSPNSKLHITAMPLLSCSHDPLSFFLLFTDDNDIVVALSCHLCQQCIHFHALE